MNKDSMSTTPNVLLVQSFEAIRHHRHIIPDITTWVQCFSINVSVMAIKHSEFVPEFVAYMRNIIRASKQFKWPAWIVYDRNIASTWLKLSRKTGIRWMPAYIQGA